MRDPEGRPTAGGTDEVFASHSYADRPACDSTNDGLPNSGGGEELGEVLVEG